MSCKEELIEDYFAAVLQAIDGTGLNENTVETINRRTVNKAAQATRGPAEVFVSAESFDGSASGSTTGTRARSGVYNITGQVPIPADALKSKAAMYSLAGDIKRVIESDPRCGGLTTSLSWTMRPMIGEAMAQCVFTVTVTFSEVRT